MIITNNKKIYKKYEFQKSLGLSNHFLERERYEVFMTLDIGFNYRMSEIHASIGIEQLKNSEIFKEVVKKIFFSI